MGALTRQTQSGRLPDDFSVNLAAYLLACEPQPNYMVVKVSLIYSTREIWRVGE